MRSIGLAGVRLRRRHRTTVPDPAAAKAPDLFGRDFTAAEPNTKYVGDITYLPSDGGKFLYLATVIDLASRRLAGCAIADHMRTDLVVDALPPPGCVTAASPGRSCTPITALSLHSTGRSPTPAQGRRPQSMSAIGSSADNALAEPAAGGRPCPRFFEPPLVIREGVLEATFSRA